MMMTTVDSSRHPDTERRRPGDGGSPSDHPRRTVSSTALWDPRRRTVDHRRTRDGCRDKPTTGKHCADFRRALHERVHGRVVRRAKWTGAWCLPILRYQCFRRPSFHVRCRHRTQRFSPHGELVHFHQVRPSSAINVDIADNDLDECAIGASGQHSRSQRSKSVHRGLHTPRSS